MNKRAQAAMEFLMTYGWALLVVLIAIAALAFFGVLNPSKFLPHTCTIGQPGWACTDDKVTVATGTFVIQNGLGVNINSGSTLALDGRDTHGNSCIQTSGAAGSILDGRSTTITVSMNPGCSLEVGTKFKAKTIWTFTPQAGISHSTVGDLVTRVEA